jgi:transposase InsO family protein
MVSPSVRRRAVNALKDDFAASERRACRTVGQPRSTQRYRPRPQPENARLTARMLELVRRHPRFGYRRIWWLLRREGWKANRKRVHRLWRRQGLKVPSRQRKKRRLGSGENACSRRRAERPDHVWTWDFIHDRTGDGRTLKWFTLVDEYTRECLALEVDRSITSREVLGVLRRLFASRGAPAHIRSDNGPEFIAAAIRTWLTVAEVETLYIEPGAPWENGFAESFQSRLRDELLNAEEFGGVTEAKVLAEDWRRMYNTERPHGSLAYRTPEEFARTCARAEHARPQVGPQVSERAEDSACVASGCAALWLGSAPPAATPGATGAEPGKLS